MHLRATSRPGPRKNGLGRRAALAGLAAAAVSAASLAAGVPASAAVQAEGVIRPAGSTRVAPASYIVVLKDSVARTQGVDTPARELSARFGGSLRHTYRNTVRGFAVQGMSEAKARKLAADPAVAYVQKDGIFKALDTQSGATWGLDRIDQRNLPLDGSYSYPTTASNVHAYIIDTGILTSHTQFGGRARFGFNAVRDGVDTDCDVDGHGTHVAGTVGGSTYGVAKGVQLVAVKVLNCQGEGTTSTVMAGVDWVTTNAIKPAVANMSIGSGADLSLDAAVQESIAAGITYSVAAGNGNALGVGQDACNFSPARVGAAITVGATDSTDTRASWSNYGNCLDLFAPGVGITSAVNTSDTATDTYDGTSMATPHVTGAAALVLSANPDNTPQQVRDTLVNNATSTAIGDAGVHSPDKLLYLGNAANETLDPATKPVAFHTSGGSMVFARSTNNRLIYRYYDSGWSPWISLGGPQIVGDPAPVYNARYGVTEVYVRSTSNQLLYRHGDGAQWGNWVNLGGYISADPAPLYNARYGVTEVYVNSGGYLNYQFYNNGWSGWIGLGGIMAGNPAPVYNARYGVTEVYVRSSANQLMYKFYNNGWSGWVNLGGYISADPAPLYNPRYGVTEVYVNSGGYLNYQFYNNGWSGWIGRGGIMSGRPNVLFNPRAGNTEVYGNLGGSLGYQYYSNGWSGWKSLGGTMTGDPAAVYHEVQGLTEVYVNSGGYVSYRNYRDGYNWYDWYTITP
jgi:subtilisin family serine protease